MLVPRHVGIQINKKAAQHGTAKGNQQELQNRCRRLQKLDKGETGRNKTSISSDNPMVTVKPRIKKNNGAQALTRRDQFIISRLRTGHDSPTGTGWTLIHRLNGEIVALDCPTFRRKKIECNISKETLSGDKDEKIELYHEI
jgi:hypothetical protein